MELLRTDGTSICERFNVSRGELLEYAICQGMDITRVDLSSSDIEHVNLSGTDLEGANFEGVYLEWVNLSGANLTDANLSWTTMYGVDMTNTDLTRATLEGADLKAVNLTGSDLFDTTIEGMVIDGAYLSCTNLVYVNSPPKYFTCDTYIIMVWEEYLRIGCQIHTIEEWSSFSDREILEMDGKKGLKWWKENKDRIFEFCDNYYGTYTGTCHETI